MQLRTYTGLWNVEKRLYKFYDISLPYPVSVKQIVILLGAAIPWLFLMSTLGVPFAPPFGHIIWLAPPVALAWWGNKPVAEGKNLPDYLQSQLSYFLGHRRYTALTPNPRTEDHHTLTAHAWRSARTPAEPAPADNTNTHPDTSTAEAPEAGNTAGARRK